MKMKLSFQHKVSVFMGIWAILFSILVLIYKISTPFMLFVSSLLCGILMIQNAFTMQFSQELLDFNGELINSQKRILENISDAVKKAKEAIGDGTEI